MKPEGRLLFLTALVYAMYALTGLVTQGILLFPFPLNEIVLFVVCVPLVYWTRHEKGNALHLGLIGLFSLLSSIIFWEVLLAPTQLYDFAQTGWSDLFLFLHYVMIALLMFRTLFAEKETPMRIACILAILGIVAALTLSFGILLLPSYLLILFVVSIRPVLGKIQIIWGFLVFFELVKVLSILINGSSY
ncbi:MAG: hypothetical protein A3D92_03020 [Bacteroidetes bacterium RIFCSPHIGHO2_02_FULL_44_7]|nr:MAG: hypothetical protein A3D92_03020 [Bacteroidetes bacterium RIFCSPHIGHO2_02_FULL_44_7]